MENIKESSSSSYNVVGQQGFKRHVSYKLKVGQIITGNLVFEGEKLNYVEINNKKVTRVNLIANVVDKYLQEGEKNYGSITLDDATGQIRSKFFGEDVEKMKELNQGDTVLIIGLLRAWNNELYLTPEIIRKKDARYLLIRKLETDLEQPKVLDDSKVAELKDKIMGMVKKNDENGGIDIDKIILELKEPPEIINREIKKLLEDGVIYEPRPAKLRYLG